MAKRDNSSSAAKQRSGTEDVGMEYQYNVITYMAAAMSENPIVDNYSIFSNLPEIPGFDDLILKVWYKGESHPHVHLGQIKHRSSKINFETEKHKLADYKRDVVQIINSKHIGFLQGVPSDNIEFLFYSNNTLMKTKAIMIDKQVPYVPLLCNVEHDGQYGSTFPVKVSKCVYKFVQHDRNYVDDEEILFLNKTRLLLNQSCNRKIIYDIINIYGEDFSKEMVTAITRYVREYFRIATVTNITKDIFENELLRIRLSKYIVQPTKAVDMKVEHSRIWNQITLNYDITMVNEGDNVPAMLCGCFWQRINDLYNCEFKWNDCINKNRRLFSDFSMQPFVDRSKAEGVRYWLSTPDTIDWLLQEMWKYADMPLMLKVEGKMSILAKYKHLGKKIILICDVKEKYKEMKTLDLRIFANASDIADTEEKCRLLDNIQVSLQGRQATTLLEITGQDQQCMEELNCSTILYLIQKRRPYLDRQALVKVELMIIIKTVTDKEIESCKLITVDDSVHQNVLINCYSANVKAYIKLISDHFKFQNYSVYRLQDSSYGLEFIFGDTNKLKFFFVDKDGNPLLFSTSDEGFPVVGNTLGWHEQVYVTRNLRTPMVDKSIFSGEPRIYFLCGNLESLDIVIRMKIIKSTDFFADIACVKNDESKFFDVPDYFSYTHRNYFKIKYPIVFLKVIEGNLLLLSYENCTDLSTYIFYGENIISEDVFFESNYSRNKVTVISGEAGMGKSALLHSLSQDYDEKSCVLFCNLTDYTQELKQSEKVKFELDYIFNKYIQTLSCYNNLLHAIYKYHRSKDRVILFIDSFDEVLPVCENEVLHFIQDIAKTNMKIIIACRIIAQKLLFNQMEVCPLTIDDLKTDDLESFLKKRNLSNIELSRIPKQFLVSPLYLNFFTFLSTKRKINFANIDLIALYKMVILEKIERYHNKIGLLYNKKMKYLNEDVLEVHRFIALVAIFGEKWLVSKKIIKNYQKLVNQLNSQKIKLGIVKDFRNGYPVFVHQTIAEFLVAEWLNENLSEEDGAIDIYKTILTKCFNNIQYFFDNMACKNLELHTAVIKGDLALVQDLCSKDYIRIDDVDKCGRNCVHLASNYCFEERNYQIMEILLNQMLRKGFDFNSREKCLKWNWLDYLNFRHTGFFEKACSFGSTTALKVYLKFEKKLISNNDISNALLNGNFQTLLFLFGINRALLVKHFDRAFNIAIDRGCPRAACTLIRLHYGNNPRYNVFLNVCKNLWPFANGMNIEYMDELKINNCTALHMASLHGNVQLIKQLLQYGHEKIIAIDACKRTPLHYAVVRGSCEIVSLLLGFKETDLNSKEESGETPLHLAVKHSKLDMVRLLLQNGARVNEKNYRGETVLIIAAARNTSNMCRILLEHDANIDERNANGSSAFLIAAERGKLNTLLLLLNYGADIVQKDCWDNTALHLACFQGHSNICNMLVKKSRDLIFIRNKSGLTPMEIVIISQNFDAIEILKKSEQSFVPNESKMPLDEESFETNEGYTPLHYAKSAEEVQVQFNSVKANHINARAHNGDTPIHMACRCGYVDVVEALLSMQADISVRNNLGETALHLAAQNNNVNIVRMLLKHGANINIVDNYMETSLHIAVKSHNINIVEVLMSEEADVNVQNYDGRSALHMAVKRHETDVAKMLLYLGANVYQLDFCNKTALHIAVEYENVEVVKVLLDFAVAMTDYVDICGNTPLHIAVIKQNVNIVKMLVKYGASAFRPNAEGISAIHIAASMQNTIIQNILLQSVTDADDFDSCKEAALRIAVLQSDVKTTLAILERGADINYTNDYNESALHVAARQGNVDMIKMLLEKDADINCVDIFMETPLHIATRYDDPDILQMFLEKKGAAINRVNNKGDTALHVAIDSQNEYILELLLRFNANMRYDKKALFRAIKHQNRELVKILLEYGLHIKNAQPALKVAVKNGNLGGVRFLIEVGVDINFMDSPNQCVLHTAVEKENIDMVNLLLDNGIYLNMVNYRKESALHLAARTGNIEILELLLRKGINIHQVDRRKKSALHVAVEWGKINVVNILLKNAIDVNIVDDWNRSALHGAVVVNSFELVKILLENGANINHCDSWGRSALYLAVQIENMNIVRHLLHNDINLKLSNSSERSALHCAVWKGNMEIIKALLKAGQNVNIVNKAGRSVLHFAIKNNDLDIVKYLLENDLDLSSWDYWKDPVLHAAIELENVNIVKLLLDKLIDVNVRNSLKQSALHIAAKKINAEIIKLLLDCDVDINAVDVEQRSALHFAIFCEADIFCDKYFDDDEDQVYNNLLVVPPTINCKKEINVTVEYLVGSKPSISKPHILKRINCVSLLLDKGININLVDDHQRSALHLAIEYLHDEVAMILLDNKADVNLTDNLGNTALHIAAQRENINAAEEILRKTIYINQANTKGQTALHISVRNQCEGIVGLLLEKGADPNSVNIFEQTPLYIATKNCDSIIMKMLLKHGAEINYVDHSKQSILHYAIKGANADVVKFILRNGGDINQCDNNNRTPLDLAHEYGYADIVKLLLQYKKK